MKMRIVVAQLLALSFSGISLTSIAAGPPPDQGGQMMGGQMMGGTGRQQVMPTIPHRDWHKGQRVPAEYRGYNFMINDWRVQGLNAPPRGHKWLGVNGDYVLVSTSNWTISNIVAATEQQ